MNADSAENYGTKPIFDKWLGFVTVNFGKIAGQAGTKARICEAKSHGGIVGVGFL
jgi:hypothetical protein